MVTKNHPPPPHHQNYHTPHVPWLHFPVNSQNPQKKTSTVTVTPNYPAGGLAKLHMASGTHSTNLSNLTKTDSTHRPTVLLLYHTPHHHTKTHPNANESCVRNQSILEPFAERTCHRHQKPSLKPHRMRYTTSEHPPPRSHSDLLFPAVFY